MTAASGPQQMEVACHSSQLGPLEDAISMHQRFLTIFFFSPEANESVIRQQQDVGQMALGAGGDWDAARAWGCGDASQLIFTDANIQNHPWRPVHHTAARFAEELDYSCSDRRGGGNSEWLLKCPLHVYFQSK